MKLKEWAKKELLTGVNSSFFYFTCLVRMSKVSFAFPLNPMLYRVLPVNDIIGERGAQLLDFDPLTLFMLFEEIWKIALMGL
ncbi:hypothetical protein [Fusibacter sp. 3D3]|uniref:hypothetical protein n=1 Tax=Fusibacter sp. 3D3 TaxID=1048380 RepID=UPI001A9A6C61|nr:hypothetical protein [Fusibacter sp. 3D3]